MASPNADELSQRTVCLNCEAPLHGEYCHACGQRDIDPRASVWSVLGEFVQESLEIDGRLPRTLLPFLFRPGFLAREFLAGRRKRYTSPVRLYLFAALLSFFMLQHGANYALEGEDVIVSSEGVKIDRSHGAVEPVVPLETEPETETEPEPETEPEASVLPERYEGLPQDALLRTLIADFFAWAPVGAAALLFIYAALLELFYRRVPFLTHLVGSTHVHAFGLLALGVAAISHRGVAVAIAAGLVQIYVLASLHTAYGERVWVTLIKWFVLNLVYVFFASLVFGGVFLLATLVG